MNSDNLGVLLLLCVILIPLLVWMMQFLWNFVMPAMFGLPEIGFFQMAALWGLARGFVGSSSS